MVIGLTGKSCAGKDLFASLLPSERFFIIDVDKLGHEALAMNRDALVKAFGDRILKDDGSVDRKILGPIVFSDSDKLAILNSITHPWRKEKALSEAEKASAEGLHAVINAALLESMGFVPHCDIVVLVIAPYEKRLERALQRDGMTPEAFRARSDAQKEIGESLFSCGRRMVTILNDGDEDNLRQQALFFASSL